MSLEENIISPGREPPPTCIVCDSCAQPVSKRGDVMLICKLHRQHTSIVMTVPKLLCKSLELCAGDYVIIEQVDSTKVAMLPKLNPKDIRNARKKRDSTGKNKGGSI